VRHLKDNLLTPSVLLDDTPLTSIITMIMLITAAGKSTIGAMEARQQFGELLDKAFYQRQSFVVERAGKAMAAIVPIALYEALQADARRQWMAFSETMREASKDLTDAEKEQLIEDAIQYARSQPV
jgi:prevent-host-death family protein